MNLPTVPGYDVLGRLGRGASAEVWRGRRHADGLPVALKLVRPKGGAADVPAVLAEAGLMAGLRHEHVLRLYDVLPLGSPQDPTVALVTQLAAGGSLAQVLQSRRLLSPGELVTVLHPVSSALAELHRLGVVHGDVSPGNVVFRSDGMPLLGDLGTARVTGEDGLRGWGTRGPDGMVAPEVVEGFAATSESDVYQVGALAWLALVGDVPGPGFDRPPLAEVAPLLAPDLVDLVRRCMAPQPEDRPGAEELPALLLAVADPEPVEVAPDVDAAVGVTERLRQVALTDAAQAQPPRGGRWRRLLARGVGRARPEPARVPDPTSPRVAASRRRGAHRESGAPAGARRRRPGLVLAAVLVLLVGVLGVVVVLRPTRRCRTGMGPRPSVLLWRTCRRPLPRPRRCGPCHPREENPTRPPRRRDRIDGTGSGTRPGPRRSSRGSSTGVPQRGRRSTPDGSRRSSPRAPRRRGQNSPSCPRPTGPGCRIRRSTSPSPGPAPRRSRTGAWRSTSRSAVHS
ncbi:hypothetical protein BJF80_12325 [Serinicoccus sp. CUA-874]|uniref:serine/threonine-protein kinase n=1 Tax=Serinicoccus sp. CUA-874 TaxID=1517939 RepID=UPI0009657357|nr:serine/threonine-protein kinase [Serinicoccus sp. CUA-874]OLT14752.1 hypothetical protein BJF80_12325 [Serinicoccus sp. CUA-874]